MSKKRSALAKNLLLATASLLLAGPLAGELGLRLGIALGIDSLRDPGLYAPQLESEDYWKLRHRWRVVPPLGENARFEHHPLFGWVARGGGERRRPHQPALLLYGDSFAQGVPPVRPRDRLPRALDRLLPGREVVDFAVSGYGLDQIYLRFRETHGAFDRPRVVIAFMVLDLDRVLFAVRDAPKPYFELRDGELELSGVPVPEPAAVDAWHENHPVAIRSYLWAFFERRLARARPIAETEVRARREEKMALGRALLEAMVEEARAHHVELVFALLYPPWDLEREGWRERFFATELERLGARWVDTRPVLREAAANHPDGALGYYLPPPNNHPNAAGNRLIAELLAARLAP